jgi:hypothetical protein
VGTCGPSSDGMGIFNFFQSKLSFYPSRALHKLEIPQAQILKISLDAIDNYSFGEIVGDR